MIAFGFLGAAGLLSTPIEPAAAAAPCSVDGVDSATSLVPAALLKNLVAANRSFSLTLVKSRTARVGRRLMTNMRYLGCLETGLPIRLRLRSSERETSTSRSPRAVTRLLVRISDSSAGIESPRFG